MMSVKHKVFHPKEANQREEGLRNLDEVRIVNHRQMRIRVRDTEEEAETNNNQ